MTNEKLKKYLVDNMKVDLLVRAANELYGCLADILIDTGESIQLTQLVDVVYEISDEMEGYTHETS